MLMYAWLAAVGLMASRNKLHWACLLSLLLFFFGWCAFELEGIGEYKLPIPFIWRLGIGFDGVRIGLLGAFFYAGSCLYLFRKALPLNGWVAIVLCAASALLDHPTYTTILAWIAIPYASIVFAHRAPSLFRRLKGVDYSYGIYIYAFPVQQAVSQFGIRNELDWFTVLAISALITVLLAAISWHFIEHPALAWKARLLPRETRG